MIPHNKERVLPDIFAVTQKYAYLVGVIGKLDRICSIVSNVLFVHYAKMDCFMVNHALIQTVFQRLVASRD